MNKKDIMLKGIEKADMNMRLNIGGPFEASSISACRRSGQWYHQKIR